MNPSVDNEYDHKPLSNNAFADGNKFFILGEFNRDMNKDIILPLTKKIEELSKTKDALIEFHINSPGGNGMVMQHIVELVEQAKAKDIIVRTIVPAYAYSAGSMLAVAGTPGERYIGHNAEHCVHYGTVYGWGETTPLQIDRNAAWKKRWFAGLLAHYKKYCAIPEVAEHIKDDSFFITAKDCIKWGVADKFMEEL